MSFYHTIQDIKKRTENFVRRIAFFSPRYCSYCDSTIENTFYRFVVIKGIIAKKRDDFRERKYESGIFCSTKCIAEFLSNKEQLDPIGRSIDFLDKCPLCGECPCCTNGRNITVKGKTVWKCGCGYIFLDYEYVS